MPALNTISVEKLNRLIGTPKGPALIDVRTEEDYAASPSLIPGSIRRPHDKTSNWAAEFGGKSAIVICHQGLKLGQVAQPLRAALTGKASSPPLFEMLALLGREESTTRLRAYAA